MRSSPGILDNCRRVLATCAVFALVGCAHTSPGPVAQPRPIQPDIRICAKIPDPPSLDPLAGFPRPITPREIDATERLKDYDLSVFGWGLEGWGRARLAKEAYCR